VIHEGMTCDPIQDQGHRGLKCAKDGQFKRLSPQSKDDGEL